jgi:O-antigen ligase
MATASRTAFLTLAGTVAWIIALRFRRTPGKLVPGALVAVCVVLSLSAFTAVAAEGALQSIYDQLGSRLVADNEGTVGTLGSRTLIWRFGLENLAATDRWAFGLGAGGVDKALGSFFELGLFAQGRDGIRRLHSHSTYIEWVLMLGFLGVLAPLALGIQTAWRSWRLDLAQGTVRRTALVVFAFLYSFGGVMNTEIFWIAFGSLLWAELTPGAPPLRPAAAAS